MREQLSIDAEVRHRLVQNQKIHHAAFDSHLLGIDPDFRIHVSRRLLGQKGGPMLELLKKMHGENLHLPARQKDAPDRDRLATRFDVFRS